MNSSDTTSNDAATATPGERLAAALSALPDDATRHARYLALAAEKARITEDAFRAHPGRNLEGHLPITLPGGRQATIGHLKATTTSDGVTCVDVWTGTPMGPPQFRIVNPPLLYPDHRGDVTITDHRGHPVRYRTDPLAAIADTITGRGPR